MSVMEMFWGLPPVARTVTSAAVVTSALVHTGLIYAATVMFTPMHLLAFPPQLWRLPTSFLLLGSGFSMLFDGYMLYRGLVALETGNPRFPRRADVVWYLAFLAIAILGILQVAVFVGLAYPMVFYFQGLIIALTYTTSQDCRHEKSTLFFFQIPTQLMPYALIAVGFIQQPDVGMYLFPLQVSGILAAHLYDFVTRLWPEFGGGSEMFRTPLWLSGLFRSGHGLDSGAAAGPTVGGRTAEPSRGTSTGVSTGPLPDAWKTRGHRLG